MRRGNGIDIEWSTRWLKWQRALRHVTFLIRTKESDSTDIAHGKGIRAVNWRYTNSRWETEAVHWTEETLAHGCASFRNICIIYTQNIYGTVPTCRQQSRLSSLNRYCNIWAAKQSSRNFGERTEPLRLLYNNVALMCNTTNEQIIIFIYLM